MTLAGQLTTVVDDAFATVRLPLPLLARKTESPANEAPTAPVPALIPLRLAPLSVATPEASVVAVPAALPLIVKLIDFPLSGVVPACSVAVSEAVPPYVPEPETLEIDVACCVGATVNLKK